MKLTRAQQDYAIERVNQIVNDKLNQIMGEQPPHKVGKSWSDKQKYDAIKDGRAVLKPRNLIHYDQWQEAFTYPELEAANKDLNKERDAWSAKRQVEYKKLNKAAQKVRDKIMLAGDADAALALLEAFAKE